MIYKKIELEIFSSGLEKTTSNLIPINSDKYHLLVTSRNLLQTNIEGHICDSTEVKAAWS